jgi:hypothetical protein
VFQLQDVVLDTLHQMGFILIYNNECYLKPYIRRVGYFILIDKVSNPSDVRFQITLIIIN